MLPIRLFGVLLGIVLLLLLFMEGKRDKELFHPTKIFLFIEFLRYVPGLLILDKESSIVFTTDGTFRVFAFELIYVFCFLLGSHVTVRHSNNSSLKQSCDPPINLIYLCFFVGFVAKLYTFARLGGIRFVLSHPALAYNMQAHGFGIIAQFYKFMLLAILAMAEKWSQHRNKKSYVITLVVMTILYMFSYLIYTNRTPGFIALLMLFFVFNFRIKKINTNIIFNKYFLITLIFILAASSYATNLRGSGNSIGSKAIKDMVLNLSNVGRDQFVYDYYSSNTKLLGRGYLNIIPSLIPGITNKPPTDDGLYLVNLIRGAYININSTFDSYPFQTGSVPFSSPGYSFANFGILGLIVGGLFMGILQNNTYKFLLRNNNSFNVSVYFYVVYSLGLSTGRLVPTLLSIVFILIFENIFRFRIKLTRGKA